MLRKSFYAALVMIATVAVPAVLPEQADAQIFVGGRGWSVGVGGYPYYGYYGYPSYGYYGYPAYYGGGYYRGYYPRYYGGYYGGYRGGYYGRGGRWR